MIQTTQPMHSRRLLRMPEHHDHDEESFPEQLKRLVIDNAFAFVLGWLLGAGHIAALLGDLAGAFT